MFIILANTSALNLSPDAALKALVLSTHLNNNLCAIRDQLTERETEAEIGSVIS